MMARIDDVRVEDRGSPWKLQWPTRPWLPLLVGLLVLTGCGLQREGAPTSTPVDPVQLLAPHWDQVCRDHRDALPFSSPDDVVQVEELQAELPGLWTEKASGRWSAEGGALPHNVPKAADEPVDVAVSFERDGQLRSVHLIPGFSVKDRSDEAGRDEPGTDDAGRDEARRDEAGTGRTRTDQARTTPTGVKEAVRRHLRPQRRFLDRTYLRLRVGGPPSHTVELLPALECLPHIQHEDHRPPTFLEGAQVQSGMPRMGDADQRTVGVTLHLSADGTLQEVEVVRGREDLLPRVRAALAETRFDPALMNGEPVPGTLTMTFRFP